MNASGTNLAETIADLMIGVERGAFGPVLRGLLVASTARPTVYSSSSGLGQVAVDLRYKERALSELIENAAVYAERNGL